MNAAPVRQARTRKMGATYLLLVAVASAVFTLVGAPTASAHTQLLTSSPAAGATLTSPPREVRLDFNEPISTSFATVSLTGPAGQQLATGPVRVDARTVTAAIDTSAVRSGAYRVRYRVVSNDGHPVAGVVSFTMRLDEASPTAPSSASSPAPSSAPAVVPSPSRSPSSRPRPETGSTTSQPPVLATETSPVARLVLPVTAGALLLLVGLGVLVWERRRG